MEGNDKQKQKLSRKEVRKQLDEIVLLFHKISPKIMKKLSKSNADLIKKCDSAIAKQHPIIPKRDSLQELIDYLRVCIKYTLFDNESLTRENIHLRNLLKEK